MDLARISAREEDATKREPVHSSSILFSESTRPLLSSLLIVESPDRNTASNGLKPFAVCLLPHRPSSIASLCSPGARLAGWLRSRRVHRLTLLASRSTRTPPPPHLPNRPLRPVQRLLRHRRGVRLARLLLLRLPNPRHSGSRCQSRGRISRRMSNRRRRRGRLASRSHTSSVLPYLILRRSGGRRRTK